MCGIATLIWTALIPAKYQIVLTRRCMGYELSVSPCEVLNLSCQTEPSRTAHMYRQTHLQFHFTFQLYQNYKKYLLF